MTDAQRAAIAAAAKELDQLRTNWLNPPEWTKTETLTFPGSADGPWARYVKDGVVHYPRLIPRDADCAVELKKRTLTKGLQRPPRLARPGPQAAGRSSVRGVWLVERDGMRSCWGSCWS